MITAFLSDIHGNLPALEAALSAADQLGASQIVVAGDLVGDGPNPVEVVTRLRERKAQCIRGNVDGEVLGLAAKRKRIERALKKPRRQKANRAWSALRMLDAPDALAWLSALEPELSLTTEAGDVLVVHGSPLGPTDYIFPSLTSVGLEAKLAPRGGERPRVLICGHSHVPFAREIDGVLVVNCGSVGRPADGDPRGSLAIVDLSSDVPRARLVRFAYPVDRVITMVAEREVPGIDPEEYRQGVKS